MSRRPEPALSTPAETGIVWGGVVPLRAGPDAREAIRSWAAARRLRRLFLVRRDSLEPPVCAAGTAGPDLISGLEAEGLAVFPFEAGLGVSVAIVAEAVGAFHFDGCDGMVAVGGDGCIELAGLVAFMAGQRRSLTELAADSRLIDPNAPVPSMAVATDLDGVAAIGGSAIVLDDRGCPFLLRDAALRPDAAAYCPYDVGDGALAAALALDAGEEGRAAAVQLHAATGGSVAAALSVAGILERHIGPARVLSAYAEVVAGTPRRLSLACLLNLFPADELRTAIATALDPSGSGKSALDGLPLDGLAHLDPSTLPVDISGALKMLGWEIPPRRRRGGRRGAARDRG